MKSPRKKSADAAREAGLDKAAERLAFYQQQRGIDPARPAKKPPIQRKPK